MPEIAQERWLTPKQLGESLGITERSARRKYLGLTSNLNGTRPLYVREVAAPRGGGRGGVRLEFCITALERDGLLPGPYTRGSDTAAHIPEEKQLVVTPHAILEKKPAPEQPSLFDSRHLDHELTREEFAQAQQRLDAITPILQARARANAFDTVEAAAQWSAKQFRINSRTLYRWLGRYDQAGFAALADRVRSDRGLSKLFGRVPESIPDDEAALAAELEKLTPAGRHLLALALRGNFNARECHERLAARPRDYGLKRPPNYHTVRTFLAAVPSALRDRARVPLKQWDAQHGPYMVRDYTTAKVNQWWVFDHAQDDYFSYNDFLPQLDRCAFPGFPQNAWLRMWITAIEDVRSRMIVGYAFCATPSSTSICSALRMAVLRTGRAPRFGLIDRGKDFLKVARAAERNGRVEWFEEQIQKPHFDEQASGALFRLIRAQWGSQGAIVKAIGENPKAKPVEPWFKLKRLRFDSKLPTWCDNDPRKRLDRVQPMLDAHRRWLRKEAPATPLVPASQAIAATMWWIENVYHAQHRHSGHGMNRSTPLEVFRAAWSEQQEKEARAKIDPRSLEEFLRDRQPRKVFNGGCIKLYNSEFEPATPEDAAVLRVWDKKDVLVACDPHALGDAVAYDPSTGERLGALVSKQLLAWGESQDTIRAKKREAYRYGRAVDRILAHFQAPVTSAAPFAFLPGFSAPSAVKELEATGTEAPAPLARRAPALTSPAFVSEAVEQHGEIFDHIELEEDDAAPRG